jgi:hypothetical protein
MEFNDEQNKTLNYENFTQSHQDYYDFMRLQQIVVQDFTQTEAEKIKKFRVSYGNTQSYNPIVYPKELYVEFRKPDGRALTSAENGKKGGRPKKSNASASGFEET